MNVGRYMIVWTLFGLLWLAQGLHACTYPVIVIVNSPKYTAPNVPETLTAECTSGGPIVQWFWTPFSLITSDPYYSEGIGSFSATGKYRVRAKARNAYGWSDYASGYVWVLKMNQVITDPCVADESELNPGLFLGKGHTATVKLRYLPPDLPTYDGGSEKLLALDSASWTVKVYDGSTLIIYGSDKEQVWPLAPTRQVTVEGYDWGLARLDLSYYRAPNTMGEADQINVTVVETDLDIPGVSDADEETVGGFLALNDNDDNYSLALDLNELAPFTPYTDNDVRDVLLTLLPDWLDTGIVKLEATANPNKIRAWNDFTRTNIIFPTGGNYYATWDISAQLPPWSVGLEGCSPSGDLRDVELTLSYSTPGRVVHADKVRMTVVDVDFVEDPTQYNGFDSYTNSFFPRLSLDASFENVARAEITPASAASNVYFVVTTGSSVSVSPSPATASPQTVTFTGSAEGSSTVHAKLGSSGPTGVDAAVIKADAYTLDWYNVAVRVVHETSYNSTDPYTEAELGSYLNGVVYNQAMVHFEVKKFDPMTVHFDLNGDGKLEVSESGWTSEQNFIINNCDPGTSYEKVVFVVDRPTLNYGGQADSPGRYAFVYPDKSTDERHDTAHELGHAIPGLPDLNVPQSADQNNLMWWQSNGGTTLRSGQWQLIQDMKPPDP